jgi:hypothetical protein
MHGIMLGEIRLSLSVEIAPTTQLLAYVVGVVDTK